MTPEMTAYCNALDKWRRCVSAVDSAQAALDAAQAVLGVAECDERCARSAVAHAEFTLRMVTLGIERKSDALELFAKL